MSYSDIQSFDQEVIRPSAILTNSYVAGVTLTDLKYKNQLVLFIDFTKGSLTTAEVKIEFSDDGVNFYQETVQGTLSGANLPETLAVHQFSATGKYMVAIPIKCSAVKVSANGTGTVTDSLMAISAIVGVQ